MKTSIPTVQGTTESANLQPPIANSDWKIQAGLRFSLAFIVVAGHLPRFVPAEGFWNKSLLKMGQFDAVTAVYCFLVISGYSIAHSIHNNPIGYYRRRLLRIYPLYACAILVALVPFLIHGPTIDTLGGTIDRPSLGNIAGNLGFLQGFFARPLTSNRPLWTIGVEVFCYLLAPLFVRMTSWQLLALTAISACSFIAHARLQLEFFSRYIYGLPALFLIWAWLGGFLLYRHRANPLYRILLLSLGVLLLCLNPTYNTKYSFFTYVGAISVVIFASELHLPKRLLDSLNYLGEISYPLYVFHAPFFLLFAGVLGFTSAPLLVGLALLGSIGFYHLVDKPIRLRGRRSKLDASMRRSPVT